MFTVKQGNAEIPINSIQSAYRVFAMNEIPEMTISAVKYNNDLAFDLIEQDSIVVVGDFEWRVQLETGRAPTKLLKLTHIISDLKKSAPFNERLTGVFNAQHIFGALLNGTGFTLQLDAAGFTTAEFKDFGRKNRWSLLKDALDFFEAEFTVAPNRTIIIKKRLSADRQQQIRYAHNMRGFTVIKDADSPVTHVIVNYGEDHAQTATFTSPTAHHYQRPHYIDPINDERILTVEDARKRAEQEFKDLEFAYELDITKHKGNFELGETVHTIYEPMNDLSLITRVQKIREDWNGEEFLLTEISVGNTVFKKRQDILFDEVDKAKKEADDKLGEQKNIIDRETNEKVTIINEAMNFRFEETVDYIDHELGEVTTQYRAEISWSAQELRQDMSANMNAVNGEMQTIRNDVSSVSQTASMIQSQVSSQEIQITAQGTRISSAESSITQQAHQIEQKVSQTDYNGNTLVSMINQTAHDVSISARKINLTGAVVVDGRISGATEISVMTDLHAGNSLYLRGFGDKAIRFATSHIMEAAHGALNLYALHGIEIGHNTKFSGTVDFSGATVIGLPE